MSLSNKMVKGMAWSMLERLSVQGIQFVLGIILARILSPTEYGTIGILTVIITFLEVLVNSSFVKTLTQNPYRIKIYLLTIFYYNNHMINVSEIKLWFPTHLYGFYQNKII